MMASTLVATIFALQLLTQWVTNRQGHLLDDGIGDTLGLIGETKSAAAALA
jgi:hypothetical protein